MWYLELISLQKQELYWIVTPVRWSDIRVYYPCVQAKFLCWFWWYERHVSHTVWRQTSQPRLAWLLCHWKHWHQISMDWYDKHFGKPATPQGQEKCWTFSSPHIEWQAFWWISWDASSSLVHIDIDHNAKPYASLHDTMHLHIHIPYGNWTIWLS